MKNYSWLNGNSRKFLKRGYLEGDETPEERIQTIADAAENYLGINGFSDKFIDYMAKGFYSLSSPIWSNFGKTRGLPISCYGTYIPDDMELILNKVSEVGTMSKVGGGTSGYFGDVRHRGAPISSGGTATGVHHQLTVFDALINYVSQSNVRRGSFAAYLPVSFGLILLTIMHRKSIKIKAKRSMQVTSVLKYSFLLRKMNHLFVICLLLI